jgi:hypothetical protein
MLHCSKTLFKNKTSYQHSIHYIYIYKQVLPNSKLTIDSFFNFQYRYQAKPAKEEKEEQGEAEGGTPAR